MEWLKDKAQGGRDYAKKHPVRFGLMTVAGFLVGVAAYWAVFQLA